MWHHFLELELVFLISTRGVTDRSECLSLNFGELGFKPGLDDAVLAVGLEYWLAISNFGLVTVTSVEI